MTGRADDTSGYVVSVEIPAVSAGDTSTVLVPVSTPYDSRVTRVDIVPRAAITANGTNFGTITVQNKGPLGSGTTAVASRAWSATNSVAGTKESATLNGTAANLELKAGDQLQVVHTTAGTGLALPAISVLITFLAR
jgi:hypothetical protein